MVAVPATSLLTATAALNAQSLTNVAVYYGQGANQQRLSHFCQETSLDIINLAFINVFPDQGPGSYPGSNFGNQCDGSTYVINGVKTELLSGCSQIAEDIPICQAAGKKVFLSLGGANPANQQILSDESAESFANFLWGAFGPVTHDWVQAGSPRPFGDAVMDGFDFDVENNGGFGYAKMIQKLRSHFDEVPTRKFYISGAPQCQIPDAQLSDAIKNAVFDYIWVQFYNTPSCAASKYAQGTPGFNFDDWVTVVKNSANPNARLLVGLPANEAAANPGFYLSPDEVRPLVSHYMTLYPDTFGGIMLWEATASNKNRIGNASYADSMKSILNDCATPLLPTPTPVPRPSSTLTPTFTPRPSSALSSGTFISPSQSLSSSPVGIPTPSSTPGASPSSTPGSKTSSSPVARAPFTSSSASSSSVSGARPSSIPSSGLSSVSSRPGSGPSSSSSPVVSSSKLPYPGGSISVPWKNVSASHSATAKLTPTITLTNTAPISLTSTAPGSGSSVAGSSSATGVVTSGVSVTTTATTATGAISVPETVTAIVVTSYVGICPTGFTTITTTYTTTYCPGTVPATTASTVPPSGPVTQAHPPPPGWTTKVTVCDHCGPTATTVTLTLPIAATATATATGTTPGNPSQGSGGSGSLESPGSKGSSSEGSKQSSCYHLGATQYVTSSEVSSVTVVVVPQPVRSGVARPTGTGLRLSSLAVKPSDSTSRVSVVAPSSTQAGAWPVFTGAGGQANLTPIFAVVTLFTTAILVLF